MKQHCSNIFFLATTTFLAATLQSCRGPQPLHLAIRSVDEKAYQSIHTPASGAPRDGFYTRKAIQHNTDESVIRAADHALSTTKNPFDARRDPRAVSRGAVIYKNECLRCHGVNVDGRGPQMPVEIPSMDFHRFATRFAVTIHGGAPKSWFQTIQNGTTIEATNSKDETITIEMPAYGERLAREQIWLVITYLQSLDTDLPTLPASPASPDSNHS